jgi:hypothetical protein
MSSELELTVTITYEGAKARITTAEEAVPAIRQGKPFSLAEQAIHPLIWYTDLTALGIPHPKRANVSVVYPGTVRFFWIARRYSVSLGTYMPVSTESDSKKFKGDPQESYSWNTAHNRPRRAP